MGKIKPSKKQNVKYNKIIKAQRQRQQGTEYSTAEDHTYCRQSRSVFIDVSQEVEVGDGSEESWREGRRVVDLGVLADALSSCKKCGVPLQLSHANGIITYGLSAIIKVPCSNTQCGSINNVPTGKRHQRIWDANTKLGTALLHAGIGSEQVNNFFAAMNIPTVSSSLIVTRQKEAGKILENIAQSTADDWLQEEVRLNEGNNGVAGITACVDAGWQKRGSGRSYDSLSGHCSMIGMQTGKIINYQVRSKTCRVCESALKLGKSAEAHDCYRNYDGSAKSMEPDMIISMVKSCKDTGIEISTVVGDDDTTTISRLKAEVDTNINKMSDKNHVRKNFANSLFGIQKLHKSLSAKVIIYLKNVLIMLYRKTKEIREL